MKERERETNFLKIRLKGIGSVGEIFLKSVRLCNEEKEEIVSAVLYYVECMSFHEM